MVCFSPRHDLSLANMDVSAIRSVVNVWAEQYRELGAMPEINHVQIFENRGEMMGCSNPHPHGQIWANHTIPNEPRKEQSALLEYQQRNQQLPALRLRRTGARCWRARDLRKRPLRRAGSVLGGVALRGHAVQQRPRR